MHEASLLKNLFQYLEQEERQASRRIKRISISLSEFGELSAEHFREHYRSAAVGTRWEALEIEIRKIPYGPELEITRLYFAETGG
jgi:Zn finger protein HypA/HybF involved in hydrogenase expression